MVPNQYNSRLKHDKENYENKLQKIQKTVSEYIFCVTQINVLNSISNQEC